MSNWYAQLAAHVSAGTTFPEALHACGGPPKKGRIQISDALKRGASIEQALAGAPRWFPREDRKFISAAAESGRLTEVLMRLSERHKSIGANQRKALFGLVYPLVIYHIAAFVTPVLTMIDYEKGFQWSTLGYLSELMLWLGPVWLLIVFVFLMQRWNVTGFFRVLDFLPVLRRYRKKQALADFAFTLSIFLEAGISIVTAWKEAAHLSGSRALAKGTKPVLEVMASGGDPNQAMRQSSAFPEDFRAFYSAGYVSGQLESSLFKAGQQFQTQANTAATLAAIIYPGSLFLFVAGRIIFIIFSVFGGYLDMVNNLFG